MDTSFQRRWEMAVTMSEQDGYVKNATLHFYCGIPLKYSATNGNAAELPVETLRVRLYKDGKRLIDGEELLNLTTSLTSRDTKLMELADALEKEVWNMNATTKLANRLEERLTYGD